MKGRDFRRLARLSLKARKKTTVQTIVGISFGLILLFPLLFLALGFYMGFNQEVDKNVSFRTFNISYVDRKTDNTYVNYCFSDYKEKIGSLPGVSKDVEFQNLGLVPADLKYKIDNPEEESRLNLGDGDRLAFNIYNIEKSSDPFVDGDYKLNTAALVSGKKFSEGADSKGEVMVSSAFVRKTGLRNSEVVGHKLTLSIPGDFGYLGVQVSTSSTESYMTSDLQGLERFEIVHEFTIVGIFSSTIYKEGSTRDNIQQNLTNTFDANSEIDTYFWFTSASLDPNGKSFPIKKEVQVSSEDSEHAYYNQWYYYETTPDEVAKSLNEDGYLYVPYGFSTYDMFASKRDNDTFSYNATELLEFNSFNSARNAFNTIEDSMKASTTVTGETINANTENIALPGFTQYLSFYDIFLYICLAFSILGGVIFIATLLNLINTLHFSIESMKGFLGICRAEGLRRRGVIRLFLNQIYWIFFYGLLATAILGGGICVGIKMAFDSAVKSTFKSMTSLSFTIEWWYLPISFGILVVITMLISIIFSELLAGKTSRTPILDILSEENK